MQTIDIERFARTTWKIFIVLLENLVKAHKVDVNVLLEAQKVVCNLISFALDRILVVCWLSARVGLFHKLLRRCDFLAKLCDFPKRKLLHLSHVLFQQLEKVLLRDIDLRRVQALSVRLRRRRHRQNPRCLIGTVQERIKAC